MGNEIVEHVFTTPEMDNGGCCGSSARPILTEQCMTISIFWSISAVVILQFIVVISIGLLAPFRALMTHVVTQMREDETHPGRGAAKLLFEFMIPCICCCCCGCLAQIPHRGRSIGTRIQEDGWPCE